MKRVTTLLTMLLILSVAALGTQAATFKLGGSYENNIVITSVDDFDDFGSLFLGNSVFSLNLNIKEKEVSIDLGVKNWTINNFDPSSSIVPISPDTADSIYLSIESPRFDGFYLQGYNPKYYYESIGDPMGIGNTIDSIMGADPLYENFYLYDDIENGDVKHNVYGIQRLMWIGGSSLYVNYNYSLVGMKSDPDFVGLAPSNALNTNYFNNLIHIKGQIGNATGKLDIEAYYIDSERKFLVPSTLDFISDGSYLPESTIAEDADKALHYMSGPVIRLAGEFSEYFVLGTTITSMNLYGVDDTDAKTYDKVYSTFGLDITGKIRYIGGEYFVSGMKTTNVDNDINSPSKEASEGIIFYAGFKNVPLGRYTQFRLGANYLSIPKKTHVFWGDSVLDEAFMFRGGPNLVEGGVYDGEKIRKVGASLGLTLGEVDVDVENNTYFVEQFDGVSANTTKLNIVFDKSDIGYWNFMAFNAWEADDGTGLANDFVTIDFDAALKLGKYVTLGASTYNIFEVRDLNGASDFASNGISSLWGHLDFVAKSGIIADSKLTLGGMVGYNYGDEIEKIKTSINDYNAVVTNGLNIADQLGNFIYDAYVGVNLNITDKARINGGLYVGRRMYEAYKYVESILNGDILSNYEADFAGWKEPLIVGTLNAQYDISSVVTASVTGTYRGKEFMLVGDPTNKYTRFDPQYYVEVALIVKPMANSYIKVGWGFNGLSDANLEGKANVRPWTYLKQPIDADVAQNWKRVTLDVSIKF